MANTTKGIKGFVRLPVETRFWSKVDKNGPVIRPELGRCWLWLGSTDGRYGQFSINGKTRKAHVVAWELANERPFPAGMNGCHSCDVTRCVRPEHVFPGTRRDNTQDAKAKGRLASGLRNGAHTQPERVRRGERISNALLNEDLVRDIRRRVASGERRSLVAKSLGVSLTCVRQAALGLRWAHVS